MTTKEIDRLTRKIIKMTPTRTFWIFGLLLPMYVIWLRHIGLFTIDKNGRSKKVFNVLSASLVIVVFVAFILGYGLQIAKHEMSDLGLLVIPFIIFANWFICNGIVGKNMVDYENRDNEYFFGLARNKEYVFRFFHLFYFPFSIYWLQKDVNKYIDSKQDIQK